MPDQSTMTDNADLRKKIIERLSGARESQKPVTRETSPQPEPSSGFDWARGLVALGHGDIGAYDKRRQEALIGEPELQRQRLQAQQLLDPKSAVSQQRQQEFGDLMRARAGILKNTNPDLAKTFESHAAAAPGMSAAQLDRMEKLYSGVMGDAGKFVDSKARADLAAENMELRKKQADVGASHEARSAQMTEAQIKNINDDNARQWAEYNLKKQEAERKKHKDESVKLRATAPDPKTLAAINDAKEAITNIDRAIKLRSENDFYTGTKGREIAQAQRGLEDIPLVGNLVKMDPSKRDYLTTLGAIAVPLRKAMIGTGQSAAELKNIDSYIPSEEQGKDYAVGALKNLRDRAVRTLGRAVADYHRKTAQPYDLPENASFEAILEAERAARIGHSQAQSEIGEAQPMVQAAQEQPRSERAIGTTIVNKKTGERMQWDGKEWKKVE